MSPECQTIDDSLEDVKPSTFRSLDLPNDKTPQHTLTYKPLGKKKMTIVNVDYGNATTAPFKKPRPR